MKTAVSQMIKELQEQFPKEMGDMYERNQLLLEDIALRAKEMEKHQRQEDTNYGYSQGWDDGNQNKEPMRPELKQQEQ